MTRPITLCEVLQADPAELQDVIDQAGRLLAQVLLMRLAVRRLPGGRELTESRLRHLAGALQEVIEDAQAALRAWQDGR